MHKLQDIILRTPRLEDGMAVFRLIDNCEPLDVNSSYCNLLQCSHFASTSAAAELNGELIGFISGYAIPARRNTLFIWQVAVAEHARGIGLATQMLEHILARPHCANIDFIETTITPDNNPSKALFRRMAKRLSTDLQSRDWLDKDIHFEGQHKSEALVRLGPINQAPSQEQ